MVAMQETNQKPSCSKEHLCWSSLALYVSIRAFGEKNSKLPAGCTKEIAKTCFRADCNLCDSEGESEIISYQNSSLCKEKQQEELHNSRQRQ